nr:hypothetical protein [Tanacetum cinerariifolium]
MPSLFADTHNMVAILEKSDAFEGFAQINYFLSGSYIHYALTVSPHIYISCIKQFWNTVVVKCSGDVTRLQALVDKRKIVISEDVIREILRLDDAEGVVCLPNEEIFAGLAQMGYEKPSTKLTFYKAFFSSQWKFLIHTILQSLSTKRTSWNEFSTAMASAVICLSKGQRFNFSRVGKGISGVETPLFDNMIEVREVDAEEEVQVPTQDNVDQENVTEEIADDVAQPTLPLPPSPVIPSSPPHQSPRPPPPQAAEGSSLLVQQVLDKCSALVLRVEGLETSNTAQQLEIIKLNARVKKLERLNKVKSSKLRRLKKVGTSQRIESSEDEENVFNQGRISVDIDEGIELVDDQEKDAQVKGRQADTQAEIYNLDLDHSSKVVAASTPIPAAKPAVVAVSTPVSAAKPVAKPKVLKITAAAPAVSTRKRKEVVIRDPKEELHDDTPAETQSAKDKGKGILVKDPKPMKKKDQIKMDAERYHGYKKKPQSESEARKNRIDYLKNTEGFKMAFFKGKTYDQIRPIFQARFDANMRFLLKSKEEMEKEQEEIIKSINETPAQKAAKRRRLREQAKEDENLKNQLDVVVDEDDDVFVKATPIGRKVPVVNYEIVMINNKPRYKIFRADDTHQLYTSFITLLKNFDREDLEDLWEIMKARFSTSKPTNFTDDYLLVTLKNMFEKTDAQDVIWRSQQTEQGQALVKSWKLLTSCGVHIITFTTTMYVLLVEKKYPLSRFTLE